MFNLNEYETFFLIWIISFLINYAFMISLNAANIKREDLFHAFIFAPLYAASLLVTVLEFLFYVAVIKTKIWWQVRKNKKAIRRNVALAEKVFKKIARLREKGTK